MLSSSANNRVQMDQRKMEPTPSSFLSAKKILKSIAANSLELSGTALQIGSEITIFVAGMGFFIAPPLKKVYAELQGKNMKYSVNGHGELCIDQPNKALINATSHLIANTTITSNTPSCLKIKDQPLLSSNILFDLAFPEQLFTASVLLFSLSCSGLAVAFALKKYGASLHEVNQEMPPSEQQVIEAKKRHRAVALISTLCLLGSRTAAIYATTTISMTMNVRSIPSILEDFSIPSSKQLTYDFGANHDNYPPELSNSTFFQVISLTMHFITHIDFSELRNAAEAGSKKIDSYDYLIGLVIAVVALILGHAAFKIQQKSDRYADILLRHQHVQELHASTMRVERIEDSYTQSDRQATNPNRVFSMRINSRDSLPVISEDDLRLDV